MNDVLLVVLVLFRLLLVGIKTGFNSMTRVDLHQIASRSAGLDDILERRVSFQFSLSLWSNLTLAAIVLVLIRMQVPLDRNHILLNIALVLLFLAVEKLIVASIVFVNREWILGKLMIMYRPIHYLVMVPLLPAYLVARRLMVIEDQREDDDEDREIEERAFIDVATEDGIIEEDEKDLIRGVLEFGETIVREIMTPRTDIVSVEWSTPYDELINVFRRAKHSRVPVYKETIDDIVGVIHLKDLIDATADEFHIKQLLQQPFYVPETKNVAELFREMQKARTKMAIILDEYGGTAGIVTVEDIVEEIVGEIEDEHDPEEIEIQEVEPGVYRVDGRCNVETLAEATGIDFDSEEIDTVGGAVFTVFGRIPEEGEEADFNGIRIRVEEMDRRRVVRILLKKLSDWKQTDREDT